MKHFVRALLGALVILVAQSLASGQAKPKPDPIQRPRYAVIKPDPFKRPRIFVPRREPIQRPRRARRPACR